MANTREVEEMKVTMNLFPLKNRLEALAGRPYTLQEMGEGMGLNKYTWLKIYNGETTMVQFDTLGKILAYFQREGLAGITIADLFVVEDDA